MPSGRCWVMRCPPHFVQYCRSLMLVFMEWPTKPAPVVTLTFSGFHKLNAFTGAADQDRHALQWQYPIASGAPFTSISTAPQKQCPSCVAMFVSALLFIAAL